VRHTRRVGTESEAMGLSHDGDLDEGVLDPQVVEWFEANPMVAQPFEDFSPEMLALARSPVGAPPTRPIDRVRDDVVDGVPVRIYQHDHPSGVVVYFHGGGFCIGSIGLMDHVARDLAHCAGTAVISVEYRLAPEHPYPAGLDDCETVTRWAVLHASQLGVSPASVVVAGESAGGNLAAAVALRLRGDHDVPLAAQVLMYPGVDGGSRTHPSKEEFAGIVLSRTTMDGFWDRYTAGRDLSRDPLAAPLQAPSLADLPPALVILGGCDPFRDEGRSYAERLRNDGVAVEEVCFAGQPHGFINFQLPAAVEAFERIGAWLGGVFAQADVTIERESDVLEWLGGKCSPARSRRFASVSVVVLLVWVCRCF
jgi:acetyl esterase